MKERFRNRLSIAVALLYLSTITFYAQENYSVSSISQEMIKNASAVIRLQEEQLTINSISSATHNFRRVVTILNEDGLSFSTYQGVEGKLLSYKFDKIIIYDSNGKKVKSFGPSQLKPSTSNSGNIYDDYRFYYVDPEYMTYPFTAEILYSVDYKGIFNLPEWCYYEDYNVSKEKSTFTVITPIGYKLRYKEQKITDGVKISDNGKTVTYRWEASNLPALQSEYYSEGLGKYSSSVFLAPADFEIDNIKGNLTTWENLGRFQTDLNKNRDILLGPTTDTVKTIISGVSDTIEMVNRIYKYMQNRTRYVSVQVGIGGWQPIEAQKVDQASYGDCKGLVNYTKSLLKVAGIKSLYTIVRTGTYEDDILTDFPSNQTNHIILCVPVNSDTLWLECTNQHMPFNYLGSSTDDRHALLVTDKGGKLVKTPKYSAEQNRLSRNAYVTLDATGNGTANVNTVYRYFFFDNKYGVLYLDQEGRKKSITNSIDIPGFSLVNFSVSQPDKDKPVLSEDLTIKLTKYATLMGDRLLVPVNLMNRIERLPSNTADRKMNIEFMRERMLTDTITYKIPVGYSVPSVPPPIEFASPFGQYKAQVTVNGNEIVYTRCIRYNKGTFPASDYPKLLEFYKNVSTADNTKVALKRTL